MTTYKYLIIPFITSIVCQSIKILIETIKYKKINIERFFDGMGGMPSTHSSLVSSLTTIIYIDYSFTSAIFAISLFFSLIVIYDSMGIRYESGKQAEVLNGVIGTNLREKIGHQPIECLVGVILGIILSIILNNIIS